MTELLTEFSMLLIRNLRVDWPLNRQSKKLMRSAIGHDLARLDDVSHYGTDGSSPVDRVFKAGYSGVMTGENVSAGQRDLDEVLDGWLKSSSHRKTLLMKEAQHVGVALAYDPKTTYRTFWTLVIAEPF